MGKGDLFRNVIAATERSKRRNTKAANAQVR